MDKSTSSPRWIHDWNPEDETFWETTGKRIARRNLIWSIVAENIGFSIWLIWSVVGDPAAQGRLPLHDRAALPAGGAPRARRRADALPVHVRGAQVRRPQLDDRERAACSSSRRSRSPSLVKRPDTPFWLMALAAATAGPRRRQLRLEHGEHLLLLSRTGRRASRSASTPPAATSASARCSSSSRSSSAASWSTSGARAAGRPHLPAERRPHVAAVHRHRRRSAPYRYMNNLTSARSTFNDQLVDRAATSTPGSCRWLYIGTFGSFIGYSAAFPLLLKTQFPEVTTNLAFLGAARRLGRAAARRQARRQDRRRAVTFWNFVAMGVATMGVHPLRRRARVRRLPGDVPRRSS